MLHSLGPLIPPQLVEGFFLCSSFHFITATKETQQSSQLPLKSLGVKDVLARPPLTGHHCAGIWWRMRECVKSGGGGWLGKEAVETGPYQCSSWTDPEAASVSPSSPFLLP